MLKKIRERKWCAKTISFGKQHKILSLIIAIVFIFIVVNIWNNTHNNQSTKYVIALASNGTVVQSVTGTGQVMTQNQIDLQAKASGDLTSLNMVTGESVKTGQLLATIDSQNALISLQNAQIALQKLVEPPNALTLLQDQNALSTAYSTGLNNVASSFLDLPTILDGLNNILFVQGGYLYDSNIAHQSSVVQAYRAQAVQSYGQAITHYNQNLIQYKNTSSTSSKQDIKSLVDNTYTTLQYISQAVKDTQTAAQYLQTEKNDQSNTSVVAIINNLSTWTNEASTHLSDVLGSKTSIESAQETLAQLQAGTDPLDIKAQQLAVQQAQNNYDNDFIYAPFDGIVAKVDVQPFDTVSAGETVATLITSQKIADITLNEVDVVKVQVGQKVTMTFDAIDGLTLTGKVISVDSVGSVSQGVVSYDVKIKFDSDDNRVKPGMSVNANIITNIKQDVLTVPNSAIKTQGNTSYVEIFNPPLQGSDITNSQGVVSATPPVMEPVVTGLSDDNNTEIISGLNSNDQVVVRTISLSTSATTQTPSILGGSRPGGNSTFRVLRGG